MSTKLRGGDNFDTGYVNNGYKGFLCLGSNSTLSSADIGKYIQILDATPSAFTVIFPTPVPDNTNGILAGSVYTIWNDSKFNITLTTPINAFQGTNLNGSNKASISMAPGVTYQIVSDGTSWCVNFINNNVRYSLSGTTLTITMV